MRKKTTSCSKEPAWLNPDNDRKTPYTDEELETLADGFILGLDAQDWEAIKAEFGEAKARKKIRAAFIKQDERNVINMTPFGTLQ